MKAVRGILRRAINAVSPRHARRERAFAPLAGAAARSAVVRAAFTWYRDCNLDIVYVPDNNGMLGAYVGRGGKRFIRLAEVPEPEAEVRRVEMLTHEIRHAWQDNRDRQSMLSQTYSLRSAVQDGLRPGFLLLCLLEADAWAHGVAAAQEVATGDPVAAHDFQTAYEEWFAEMLPDYLPAYVSNWEPLLQWAEDARANGMSLEKILAVYEKKLGDEGALSPQEALPRLGISLNGIDYMQAGAFARVVHDRLLPQAEALMEKSDDATWLSAQSRLQALKRPAVPAAERRRHV